MVMMSYIKCSVEQSQLSVIIKTTAAVNLLTEIKKHSVTCLLALSPSVRSGTLKMGEAKVKSLSRVRLLASPWTVAHQASPSLGFSRQEYWSGLPFPSPGESSRPRDRTWVSRIEGRCFNLSATGKPLKGTSGGLIAILYFKHSFALEPIEVSESSSHSELRPSTAAHHLPVQWKQGVPEKGSPELGARVWSLQEKQVSGSFRSSYSFRPSLSTRGQ